MNPEALSTLDDFQLLDVRLADDFEAAHLDGAKNNCVFEVDFVNRLPDTAPDKTLTTVVYGANADSQEAEAALEKLTREGYTSVQILEGGIEAAESAGLSIVNGDPLPDAPAAADGVLGIDLAESTVEWLGRNLINKHFGFAKLESGQLEFADGVLTGGEFSIDLRQLECTDLKDSKLHDVLIHHLESDDFFDVANHPTARFVITGSTPIADACPGGPNLEIEGDLTLRGKTESIQFTATAGLTPEGTPAAQAAFAIDRTRWGVLYGSGKFFKRLAGHLVNDQIEFQLRIITEGS